MEEKYFTKNNEQFYINTFFVYTQNYFEIFLFLSIKNNLFFSKLFILLK